GGRCAESGPCEFDSHRRYWTCDDSRGLLQFRTAWNWGLRKKIVSGRYLLVAGAWSTGRRVTANASPRGRRSVESGRDYWSPALRQGRGMCGNQQVHGTDRLTSLFQLVPDAAVMRGAGRAVVIEHFEGRQDLSNSDDLGVIVAAVVGAEFQFRYRNGRQSDHVTLRLC